LVTLIGLDWVATGGISFWFEELWPEGIRSLGGLLEMVRRTGCLMLSCFLLPWRMGSSFTFSAGGGRGLIYLAWGEK